MRAGAAALILTALVFVPCAGGQPAGDLGRQLYDEGCASCHGLNGEGVGDEAPSLRDAGPAAVDFYLSTGRMPLDASDEQPLRNEPAYSRAEVDALIEYIASFAGAEPAIPEPQPERGDLAEGMEAFTTFCAGCHQMLGEGGVVIGGFAPALTESTPTQVAEAVRVGPYLMPAFGEETIDDETLDSIVRYVEYTKDPVDAGGWGIGHIGPVPEGLVAWLVAAAALVFVIRLLGERS